MLMTKATAQHIQARQIEHWGRTYGLDRVRELVFAADTSEVLVEGEYDIETINRHIPRGYDIEMLIPEIRNCERATQARLGNKT